MMDKVQLNGDWKQLSSRWDVTQLQMGFVCMGIDQLGIGCILQLIEEWDVVQFGMGCSSTMYVIQLNQGWCEAFKGMGYTLYNNEECTVAQ